MTGGNRRAPLFALVTVGIATLASSACTTSRGVPPALPSPVSGGAVSPLVMECAPFARSLAGLDLRGAAADWWPQAEGRYVRTTTPTVGAVLVFRRTARLADGHVAVVSAVRSDRQILVTHANWARHWLSEDAPVIDVSPDNDWSQVRVWWPPTAQMGATTYATFGFIQPDRPPSRDDIAAATRWAVTLASGS